MPVGILQAHKVRHRSNDVCPLVTPKYWKPFRRIMIETLELKP